MTPTEPELTAALARWPNVHRDDRGRIIAFSGLSLAPTPHRFSVEGRRLYAWCAWDTLFLPALLGQPADVHSNCPATGTDVRLSVRPAGVIDSEPDAIRVSFPPPSATSTTDVTGSFCCHVHFLAGHQAADRWLIRHPGGVALTLDEAFRLGRMVTGCCTEGSSRSDGHTTS